MSNTILAVALDNARIRAAAWERRGEVVRIIGAPNVAVESVMRERAQAL